MPESSITDRLIIPYDLARDIVRQAAKIFVHECPCRAEAKRCPRDTWDVCLRFENATAEALQSAKPITAAQAEEILAAAHERGEIHNLFYDRDSRKVSELCNCCSCCCEPLQELKQATNYEEQLHSGYIALTDTSLCAGCGECLDACFFEARQLDDGVLHLRAERCFGCGKCIASCPQDAIRLEMQSGRQVQPFH